MSDSFFKTLIITAFIGLLFYLVFTSIKKIPIFEGLTTLPSTTNNSSKTKNVTNVSEHIQTLKEALSIDKRKQSYEDFIVNLEEACNLQMLSVLYNASDPLDPKLLESINTMNNAKSTLNDLMKYLDSQ
jgi:predicted PurR-regulated permease PerM